MLLIEKPIVGVSLDALFDLTKAKAIMQASSNEPYDAPCAVATSQEVPPNIAFNLIQKLLALKHPGTGVRLLDVTVLAKDTGIDGILGYQGIKLHQLNVSRMVFTREQEPKQYVREFNIDLLLSAQESEVKQVLKKRCAAVMLVESSGKDSHAHEIKIAFDADAILCDHGVAQVNSALILAPFKKFLGVLNQVQKYASAELCPIRVALMSGQRAHGYQACNYLKQYGIRVDETIFLDGLNKTHFLKTFGAELFFNG